ncbi:agglutinin biogenesis protein MshP [Pseudoduganella flava]|nr:agglutinin biogenesis protein MshP [Pseudoduganella flava]
MLSHLNRVPRLRRAAGVTIVTAVFLLVVLAGLGVAIVALSTAQHRASALDLLGTRAYEAARSGAQYEMFQLNRNNTCGNVNFQAPGSLATMTVSVTCSTISVNMTDGSQQAKTTIVSTACNQPTAAGACPNPAPGADYVQRVVQVVF